MHIPQAKAKGILLRWGQFRFAFAHAALYVGMIQMLLIVLIAYNTTLKPWITDYLGWNIAFWQYCLVLGVLLVVGMALEFVFGVPSYLTVVNEQTYKHNNPIKIGLDEVKEKQKEIEDKLDKVMKHLGIEE